MSGKEKPQSENPFKYGDELLSPDESKWRVNAVAGDMVSVYRVATGDVEWSTFKRLLDHNWRKVPTRKWEDLTAENWRERRDQPVWVNLNGSARVENLIWFNPNEPHFLTVDRSGFVDTWNHASIYNDDGEEARWEER